MRAGTGGCVSLAGRRSGPDRPLCGRWTMMASRVRKPADIGMFAIRSSGLCGARRTAGRRRRSGRERHRGRYYPRQGRALPLSARRSPRPMATGPCTRAWMASSPSASGPTTKSFAAAHRTPHRLCVTGRAGWGTWVCPDRRSRVRRACRGRARLPESAGCEEFHITFGIRARNSRVSAQRPVAPQALGPRRCAPLATVTWLATSATWRSR